MHFADVNKHCNEQRMGQRLVETQPPHYQLSAPRGLSCQTIDEVVAFAIGRLFSHIPDRSDSYRDQLAALLYSTLVAIISSTVSSHLSFGSLYYWVLTFSEPFLENISSLDFEADVDRVVQSIVTCTNDRWYDTH